MTFDEWYATQKQHQLSNEQVCRVIWEAAAREENKNLREQVAHLSLYKPARRTEQPISRVHPDYPGDGKPRFKTFGIIAWTPDLRDAVSVAKSLHKIVNWMTLFSSRQGEPLAVQTVRDWWMKAGTPWQHAGRSR